MESKEASSPPDHRHDEEHGNDNDAAGKAAKSIGQRPECFKSTFTEVLYVTTCTMAVGMQALLQGSVTVITSFIADDLNMTTAQTTWIVASSSLTCGSFLLFFGRVADLFGRKFLFVLSLFLFAVFSLAAGFSRTALTLDVLNGVLGFLSASAVPPAIGSLGITYGKGSRRKNYAFAFFSAGNPLGYIFGTIFSGVATKLFSWRASFWLLAIIYLLTTILAIFAMPKDTSEKLPLSWHALKKFDVVGALSITAGIGMFVSALSLGGDAPHGWRTPYVIVLLVLGVALLIFFVVWELYYPHPILPMWIWKDVDFSLINLVIVLTFLAFPTALFWITLYIQRAWTGSALHVALYLLPAAIVGILINVFAALVLHRIRNQILVGVGCITYVISFLLLALDGSKNGYWPFVFPALMLIVWGADLHFNVANVSHALSTPKLPKPAIANPNVSDVKRANPHPKPFPHQTHN